jgi:hypothetical protein
MLANNSSDKHNKTLKLLIGQDATPPLMQMRKVLAASEAC